MKPEPRVVIKGQIFKWGEKSPYERSGDSVRGALELNSGKVKCHECGDWFSALGVHVAAKHDGVRAYTINHGLSVGTALISPRLSEHLSTTGGGAAFRRMWKDPVLRASQIERVKLRMKRDQYQPPKGSRWSTEERNRRRECRAQLLERLRVIAEDLRRSPRGAELPRAFVAKLVRSFGSYRKALTAGEMLPAPCHNEYPREVLIEMLRDFYVLNGRLPRDRDWKTGVLPDRKAYYRVFGSLPAAYEASGLLFRILSSNAAD
jgi:hypothetical protein